MSKAYDTRTEVTIKLDFPITVDGREIAEVTMRRPKVRDTLAARKLGGDEVTRGIVLLANLCNLAPEHIHEMDDVDAEKLQAQYESFRGERPGSATTI